MDFARLRNDTIALGLLALAVFLGLSLASYDPTDSASRLVFPARHITQNLCGELGATVAFQLLSNLGYGAWILLLMLVVLDLRLFTRSETVDAPTQIPGYLLGLCAICTMIQLAVPWAGPSLASGAGGYLGAIVADLLAEHFTFVGTLSLLFSMLVASLLLTDELRLIGVLGSIALTVATLPFFLLFGWKRRSASVPQLAGLTQGTEGLSTTASAEHRGGKEVETSPASTSSVHTSATETATDTLSQLRAAALPTNATIPFPLTFREETENAHSGDTPRATLAEMFKVVSDVDDPIGLSLFDGDEAHRALVPDAAAHEDESPRIIKVNAPVSLATASLATINSPEPVTNASVNTIPVNAVTSTPTPFTVNKPPVNVGIATTSANYKLPGYEMLEESEAFPYEQLAQKAQLSAATLEKTFKEFGLNVKVVEIDTGPVITQFELELEAGLRLSKVTALADDLAIALRVPSVRVVAPIPGKNTVGVEVPNDLRVMVRLKELIQSSPKDFEDKRIPLYLGKDVSGKPLVVDMCKMPHLLIAGRTGTGKSVCLNTLILSILMTRRPDQVKMLMIDPKMVELSPYNRIPHLMHPVITDMKKAEAVLGWAVEKMEERYDLLARVGVRHLDNYNKLGKAAVLERLDLDPESEDAEAIPESMPYIVIIADEMADMMMTSGKDVEGHIIRLAQKSRAVGIHLVLATQKPTVDVITGLIKSNLPARISFQVASRMDSRVVLDENGADKLLGNGDMLYMAPGTSVLSRAQGTYVSDEEVNGVIEFFEDMPTQYDAELQKLKVPAKDGKAAAGGPSAGERDDLYDQAVEVIIREGRGSVSLLQRALGVGYGRGARLIDYMAEDGIVGTYNGSQAREVIMTMDEWEDRRSSR